MRLRALALGLALVAGVTAPAWAQAPGGDRPSEQDMFGGASTPAAPTAPQPAPASAAAPPSAPAPPAAAPAAAAAGGGTDRDQDILGTGDSKFLADYVAPENPLQIGGQLYLRAQSTASAHQYPSAWSMAAPSLLDVYLDARPNPRVRAFILGRMAYDPTLLPNGTSNGLGTSAGGALAGGNPTGFSTFSNTRGPTSLLDQMWIRFDILEHVFVTAGKQHVRWGTGHFWQPTDYLHPIRRNPLDVFDARAGTTMLKLNIPWEEKGWNFYGFAIAEDPNATTPTLRQVAGAFRAEVVLAGIELGVDTYLRRDQKARYGFDASTGIGDFDVYADVGVRPGDDFYHYDPDQQVLGVFTGYETQVVGGITYSRKYNDNDAWTVGAEYFYNHPGYSSPSTYPQAIQAVFDNLKSSNPDPMLQLNPFAPLPFFYLGQQYGAVYLSLPAPYSWNYTTFTLSTLGNLSDRSFITRLDYSVTLLTHLSFEAFAGVHYGHIGGEFRLELPPGLASEIAASAPTAVLNDYPVVDLGAALRLKI
jgi:uncharacterized protein YfiM (DUF2279 family)